MGGGAWGSPHLLPHGEGVPVSTAPSLAAAKRFQSQESQTLSRDFTAALGRMSHPGRGARRQPRTRPLRTSGARKGSGTCIPPALAPTVLPEASGERQWRWCQLPWCGGVARRGAAHPLCPPSSRLRTAGLVGKCQGPCGYRCWREGARGSKRLFEERRKQRAETKGNGLKREEDKQSPRHHGTTTDPRCHHAPHAHGATLAASRSLAPPVPRGHGLHGHRGGV